MHKNHQVSAHLRPSSYIYIFLWGGILAVYILGAFLDIMDIDAAQYASISRDMMRSADWRFVYERGHDYLDKPPLLFWFTALAFQLFGVSNFVYRLFPIIFSILGAYATYRFGKLYYNTEVGKLAAVVLASSQALFLMNHDVRTDTMLTASVMMAIWQIAEYIEKKKWYNLFFGFVAIGLAMLAKGPIGLMVPILAFSTDFILKRRWALFFQWEWLIGLGIVALILSPMVIGLYQQFDLHPEKVVNNKTGVSGLYFYFWEQSFGRLTGENEWKDNSDAFFFVHTFIWSFLPWSFLFILGFIQNIRTVIRQRFKMLASQEAISLGGFLLAFIALSFSHYKLPHYIYVFFPLAAVITGQYMYDLLYKELPRSWKRISQALQILTVIVLWLLAAWLVLVAFPMKAWYKYLISILFLGMAIYPIFTKVSPFYKFIIPAWASIIGVNFLLNGHIYPNLFEYQTGSQVAHYARYEVEAPPKRLYALGEEAYIYMPSLDFYSTEHIGGFVSGIEELDNLANGEKLWIFTDAWGLKALDALMGEWKVLKKFERYHISKLTPKFLNPHTRSETTQSVYLIEYKPKQSS